MFFRVFYFTVVRSLLYERFLRGLAMTSQLLLEFFNLVWLPGFRPSYLPAVFVPDFHYSCDCTVKWWGDPFLCPLPDLSGVRGISECPAVKSFDGELTDMSVSPLQVIASAAGLAVLFSSLLELVLRVLRPPTRPELADSQPVRFLWHNRKKNMYCMQDIISPA